MDSEKKTIFLFQTRNTSLMGSCFSIVGRMVTNHYTAGLGCSHGAGKDTVIGIALKISGVYMTSDKAVWVGERGNFFLQ